MNRILLRGGLCRATRSSGTPSFLQTGVVRYQSSEEVARDRQEDDDVEAGKAANTLGNDGPPLKQANGSGNHCGEGVAARRRRPVWQIDGALPQNGLLGSDHSHFSRPGQVGGTDRAVSAPPAPPGSLNGADFSPLSRVNGKDSPAVSGDDNKARVVNGAGAPTLPVSRNVAARPHQRQRGQNNNNNDSNSNSSNRQAPNPWDSLLKLKDGGVGANGGAQATDPSTGGGAAVRSDPLRSPLPLSAPNGASNPKVSTVMCFRGQCTRMRRKRRCTASACCVQRVDASSLIFSKLDCVELFLQAGLVLHAAFVWRARAP